MDGKLPSETVMPSIYKYLSKEEQETVLEVVAANSFIVNTFNVNGEKDHRTINIRDNEEYEEFVLGICKQLSLKKFKKGDAICHRGDHGEEMYLILHGKVGVFIENKPADIVEQRKKAELLYEQIKESIVRQATWETVLKNVEFSRTEALVNNCKIFPNEEHAFLKMILSYFELANFWRKELLYLLTTNRPQQYFEKRAFTYWMAAAKRPGDIIGEQALLNRTPRNATLIALTDVELLTLDKATFDSYLGAATLKQEERIQFFLHCFPTLSKRSINNFQCMFQRVVKSRGDVLARADRPVTHLYIVEEGEVALVEANKLEAMKKIEITKLDTIVTISKGGLVGDEVFLQEEYRFSVVTLRQPTFLYAIEKSKLETAIAILGKYVIAEIIDTAKDKISYRLARQKIMEANTKRKPVKEAVVVKRRPNLHFFNVKQAPSHLLDEQFKQVNIISDMIKGLVQPPDIRDKYTVVKEKYKIKKELKPANQTRKNCIQMNQYSFLLGDQHGSSGKMLAKTKSCQMLRSSNFFNPILKEFEAPETKTDFSIQLDSAFVVNHQNSFIVDREPRKEHKPRPSQSSEKKFLHLSLSTKEKYHFKNGLRKPSFICNRGRGRNSIHSLNNSSSSPQPSSPQKDLKRFLTTAQKPNTPNQSKQLLLPSRLRGDSFSKPQTGDVSGVFRPTINQSAADLSMHQITHSTSKISKHRRVRSISMFQ